MQVHFQCYVPPESLPYFGRFLRGCTVWNNALRSYVVVPNQRTINGDRWTRREEAWRKYALNTPIELILVNVKTLRLSVILFESTKFRDKFLQAQNISDHGYVVIYISQHPFVELLASQRHCLAVYFRLVRQLYMQPHMV